MVRQDGSDVAIKASDVALEDAFFRAQRSLVNSARAANGRVMQQVASKEFEHYIIIHDRIAKFGSRIYLKCSLSLI